MAQKTKHDLEVEIERLKRDLESIKRQRDELMTPAGVVNDSYAGNKQQYLTIPVDRSWDLLEYASECLCRGDFHTEENVTHKHIIDVGFYEDDRLPPSTDHLYVEYAYSDQDGIIVDRVWKAVKV